MIPINDLIRHSATVAREVQAATSRVVDSGWYVLGPEVSAFEKEFATYCGMPYCVGVGNGTDALELGLRALDVGPGDVVATVANAGMYSSAAIAAIGAIPIYVDIDDTLTMSPAALAGVLGSGVRAVVVTHLYGRMANMPAILDCCRNAEVSIIEDCAQAVGAELNGTSAGAWGDVGCFSFYPTKNLGAIGDGGGVVARDAAVAERIRALRQYGWTRKYDATFSSGRNSRLDELQAAVLRAKLPYLKGWNLRRREIADRYLDSIRNAAVRLPPASDATYVAHLYVVRTDARDSLRIHLAESGISSEVHYPIPDYRQLALAGIAAFEELPETERACREILSLPCFPEMSNEEVDIVAQAVNRWTATCTP
jgi:aminotransferase EvaB